MKKIAFKILYNRYVENFILFLIVVNLIFFIFQTDTVLYSKFKPIFLTFDLFSVIIFTLEYFLRLFTLQKVTDIFKPLMVVDLLSILPFYASFAAINTSALRALRLFRFLRIAKITRYTNALDNIKNAFLSKKNEIAVTGMIFLCGITVSSILIYYAEHNGTQQAFSSIPSAYWWSVVTFTSVGYGDAIPATTAGKIIGSFAAVMGVGMHGLLVGVIGAAFIEAMEKNKKNKIEELEKNLK